jgi:23S rRNA (cytidine2498-2'-O)-methyltransferase
MPSVRATVAMLRLVQRWLDAGTVRNVICTIKFHGVTDQGAVREFQAIPGARVLHLHHNRDELTFIRVQEE